MIGQFVSRVTVVQRRSWRRTLAAGRKKTVDLGRQRKA